MANTKEPVDRKMVNLSPYAAAILADRKAKIDKQRKKIGKPEIKINKLIEIAIENLTVEMGASR